jgi:hypothetical protein
MAQADTATRLPGTECQAGQGIDRRDVRLDDDRDIAQDHGQGTTTGKRLDLISQGA